MDARYSKLDDGERESISGPRIRHNLSATHFAPTPAEPSVRSPDSYYTPWSPVSSQRTLHDTSSYLGTPSYEVKGFSHPSRGRPTSSRPTSIVLPPQTPTNPGFLSPHSRHSRHSSNPSSPFEFHEMERTTTVNSQTSFLSPKSPKPRSNWKAEVHPFASGYEPIDWSGTVWFTIPVLVTWPLLQASCYIARDQSLYVVRAIISAACGLIGLWIGTMLTIIALRTLEATTWATILHESRDEGAQGISLDQLQDMTMYPQIMMLGISLLFHRIRRATKQTWRQQTDTRRWSLYVVWFILLVIFSSILGFVFGRWINITVTDVRQLDQYREVVVIGDLTEEDVARASEQLGAFQAFIQTWTLAPFGDSKKVPAPVKLAWQDSNVYFAEASTHQLTEYGWGPGTFNMNQSAPVDEVDPTTLVIQEVKRIDGQYAVGSLIRWPRWGIRIQCSSIPEPEVNIVPMSPLNRTYVFVPDQTISDLFAGLQLEEPERNFNISRILSAGDEAPNDGEGYSWAGGFWSNGIAQSFFSNPVSMGEDGHGWIELEMILIRINTTFTPDGTFPVYSEQEGPDGSRIGYDAAVCLEVIEPFVVETFNGTTNDPHTFRVVQDGKIDDLSDGTKGAIQGIRQKIKTRFLDSTGKANAFAVAHDHSRNSILKDNSRDFWYTPSPTLVSFSDGFGPSGYTSLSVPHLENALAFADGYNLLPFLSGSGQVVGFQYIDRPLASADIFLLPLIITLIVILFVGYSAAFFVPKLPFGVPRRDFSFFTWLAIQEGDGLLDEHITSELLLSMPLQEVREKVGAKKVRYGLYS